MANRVIANRIEEKLRELHVDNNSIVVLKGIPMSVVDPDIDRINLSEVISNKLGYFMSIFGRRRFLSYEEFLLLSDFVVSQYKEIIILDNNYLLTTE
jgi:ATP-dependent DNA helicase RecQ